MAYKYSTPIGENCAKAVGVALPISRKQSIMVCKYIRNKNIQWAKKQLAEVILKKCAVPFTRFSDDVGHKAGMAAGRYPVKTCTHILALLESAESNAQFKGLSTGDLIITHISAQKGPDTWRYGRHIRRQAKRTHIEIVLEERKTPKTESKAKKIGNSKKFPNSQNNNSVKKSSKPKTTETKKETPQVKEKPQVKPEVKQPEPKAAVAKEKPAETKKPVQIPKAEEKKEENPAVKKEKQEVKAK
ncbi:50S ribosomal protein L22 [Candidatus Woesearchaeota archaeon]|nr:50S ribosomal protein L22 [Candidatus Woesearchaeota archaeon]MBW2993904.1 50S ribosomal protein L22 [Candidatus Woesearchaeota archaeon]